MPKKIFIVDDADFIVDMLRLILEDAGHVIVGVAFNGEHALELVRNLPPSSMPDIVTVDFYMPKLGGMETIEEIRSLAPGAKFVLISSHATRAVVQMAKKAGVYAFIVKPFDPQTVLDAIANL